jgi:glutamine amidotransferase
MLLAQTSERRDGVPCGLGWFRRCVAPIPTIAEKFRIWAGTCDKERDHPILAGIRESNLAFISCIPSPCAVIIRATWSDVRTWSAGTAIIARTTSPPQFHPESQDSGIELVSNFLRWNP